MDTKKVFSGVSEHQSHAEVYHVPCKYAPDFHIFTDGVNPRYLNNKQEVAEHLDKNGYNNSDFVHIDTAGKVDRAVTEVERQLDDLAPILDQLKGGDTDA